MFSSAWVLGRRRSTPWTRAGRDGGRLISDPHAVLERAELDEFVMDASVSDKDCAGLKTSGKEVTVNVLVVDDSVRNDEPSRMEIRLLAASLRLRR